MGMLSTNAHAVITEDWTPGGNAQCLVQQQQNERNNKDDEFQLSSLFSAPKRLGIFRHITHDETTTFEGDNRTKECKSRSRSGSNINYAPSEGTDEYFFEEGEIVH